MDSSTRLAVGGHPRCPSVARNRFWNPKSFFGRLRGMVSLPRSLFPIGSRSGIRGEFGRRGSWAIVRGIGGRDAKIPRDAIRPGSLYRYCPASDADRFDRQADCRWLTGGVGAAMLSHLGVAVAHTCSCSLMLLRPVLRPFGCEHR